MADTMTKSRQLHLNRQGFFMREANNKNSVMKIGVIDFFAGCGGASYGFSKAKIPNVSVELVSGIDFDSYACATYSRMLGVPAQNLDVRELMKNGGLKLDQLVASWKLSRFDKVVLIGCAPCQGFAAHRKSASGVDRRRNLLAIFAEVAKKIRPDAVFMENVPDLFSKSYWPYYKHARSILEDAGYYVRSRIYNFAEFGLPQERFRAVILAFRKPFNMPDPRTKRFKTVKQAIGHLPFVNAGAADPRDPMHIVSKHRPETISILRKVPKDGGNRPVGVGPKCLDIARLRHGGYTDVYGRLSWNKPAVTVTARCRTPSCGRFAHPEQDRGLSVREAALLQGFPRNFIFEGPFDDKFKQIGNAVPPLVAQKIAKHIFACLMEKKGAVSSEINGYTNDVSVPVGPGFAVTINGIKRKRESANQKAVNPQNE